MLSPRASETVEFVSFDGGVTETCERFRPDRYRAIQTGWTKAPATIARGGGYSYAAASFGGGSSVLDLTEFDRILGFDEDAMRIEVQAGATLGTVLSVTGPRNLILSVQPGYPRITVGGCIAANVHGKNPYLEGTFTDQVESLTLFHPRFGTREIDRRSAPELFLLTCGGLGLSGVILSATLRLKAIAGWTARVERTEIASLSDGLRAVRSMSEGSAFAYTWHDGVPRRSTFGRGFVYRGNIVDGAPFSEIGETVSPDRLGLARSSSVFSPRRLSAGLLTRFFWTSERSSRRPSQCRCSKRCSRSRADRSTFSSSADAVSPKPSSSFPTDRSKDSSTSSNEGSRREQPPSVMISMKRFRGTPRLLCFEGNGICLTLDFARDDATEKFLRAFDEMCVDAGALPNVIKDSRIPRETVRRCYPEYEEFRERLNAYDPERLFRSELSQRLGI